MADVQKAALSLSGPGGLPGGRGSEFSPKPEVATTGVRHRARRKWKQPQRGSGKHPPCILPCWVFGGISCSTDSWVSCSTGTAARPGHGAGSQEWGGWGAFHLSGTLESQQIEGRDWREKRAVPRGCHGHPGPVSGAISLRK